MFCASCGYSLRSLDKKCPRCGGNKRQREAHNADTVLEVVVTPALPTGEPEPAPDPAPHRYPQEFLRSGQQPTGGVWGSPPAGLPTDGLGPKGCFVATNPLSRGCSGLSCCCLIPALVFFYLAYLLVSALFGG